MFTASAHPIVLRQVRIVTADATSAPQDILIENGRIAAIGLTLAVPTGTQEMHWPNAHVSIGWFDLGTQVCDPGHEHREDLHTAAAAAAAGGFTAIACQPNTLPALHAKSEVLYIKNKAAQGRLGVEIHPIGAISMDCKGKDLAELYDMHNAGAVAFSDGPHAIQDAGLILRALQYASAFGGLVINQPMHNTIAAGGQIHEGLVSTELGLKGIPALAEELMVQRDLSLLEYVTGGRLHVSGVSTAKSVELIRAAKQAGLPVTASVAIANLCYTDQVLAMTDTQAGFDSNWKVLPPLRAESDRQALLAGLLDGTIDCICSNHVPCDEEAKNLEFTYADFGMIALESCFAMARTSLHKELTINQLIEKMAIAPRRILRLPMPAIEEGQPANLTVFDPDIDYVFERSMIRSRSQNSPLIGQTLKGRVLF
jgi:dihydroorotase